jgi:predicted transcriptional regulator
MSDVKYVLFARGKKVTDEMLELANENDMVIMITSFSMFKTSGVLYGAGLKPVY